MRDPSDLRESDPSSGPGRFPRNLRRAAFRKDDLAGVPAIHDGMFKDPDSGMPPVLSLLPPWKSPHAAKGRLRPALEPHAPPIVPRDPDRPGDPGYCRPVALRGELRDPVAPVRAAKGTHWTFAATRRPGRADAGPQIHQRLIRIARLVGIQQSSRLVLEIAGRSRPDHGDATEDTDHVAVDDGERDPERDAEDRAGHVWTDAG